MPRVGNTNSLGKRGATDALAEILGKRADVDAVAVYGSVARRTAVASSDIDLLVVAQRPISPCQLISELPVEHQRPDLSLSVFTWETLRTHLQAWSRFAIHLQRESLVLHDSTGGLKTLLLREINVSVTHELAAQQRRLQNFRHLDRFEGRLLFPLAHMYGIGRTIVFARLAQYGQFEFERSNAFAYLKSLDDELTVDLEEIEGLAPFYESVRHPEVDVSLPYDPVGEEATVFATRARGAIERLLRVAVREKHARS